ncbi:MAG: M42 family metallopeptidase [Armatimonadetes bacterium]|nr:M20/M25/M40 family metallo-hydrolase [Armatimonadota bacterium]MBS1703001.1 M42 family metallopeptidase [Armatimonadota bacterium]MBS1727441.1 M42 family metallopeptidase [Armatimonadota bacterium]
MARFEISDDYLKRFLVDLLQTPSPTGDTEYAISLIEGELMNLDIPTTRTTKGALLAHLEGLRDSAPKALTAHVDTLGFQVKEIKSNGRLKLKALNGIMWPTVDSQVVTISTRDGRQITGSIVFENGAAHVNKDATVAARNSENLEVRLDELTTKAEETRFLGIEVGDYVYLDPRTEITASGFIRSRFLDDKASVACAIAALEALKKSQLTPVQRTTVLFSNFEEVGHGGMDGLPPDLAELVVLDMACVGVGQNGTELNCSICTADSSGPYSKNLTDRIRNLAERRGIELKPDIYPYYGSDGSAYWRSGGGAEVALIGPGVDTSHGYERTHIDALRDTAQLIAEYLIDE